MPHLEPTYLRYIYDGLIKGNIHPENAAELPEGLIGLYEEAFDERASVIERQKLLQQFAIWGLLKKEVSAAFVAEVLGQPEEEILDFISTYSAWFNSPESGKYQLYHERLKVFILQKLTEGETNQLNERISDYLLRKLKAKSGSDAELYALRYLSHHLMIHYLLSKDIKPILDLVNNASFRERQILVSNGQFWTLNSIRNGINASLLANKDQDTIEQVINYLSVELNLTNDLDRLIEILENGDQDNTLNTLSYIQKYRSDKLEFILTYILCMAVGQSNESKKISILKGVESFMATMDEEMELKLLPDMIKFDLADFSFRNNILFDHLYQKISIEIARERTFNNRPPDIDLTRYRDFIIYLLRERKDRLSSGFKDTVLWVGLKKKEPAIVDMILEGGFTNFSLKTAELLAYKYFLENNKSKFLEVITLKEEFIFMWKTLTMRMYLFQRYDRTIEFIDGIPDKFHSSGLRSQLAEGFLILSEYDRAQAMIDSLKKDNAFFEEDDSDSNSIISMLELKKSILLKPEEAIQHVESSLTTINNVISALGYREASKEYALSLYRQCKFNLFDLNNESINTISFLMGREGAADELISEYRKDLRKRSNELFLGGYRWEDECALHFLKGLSTKSDREFHSIFTKVFDFLTSAENLGALSISSELISTRLLFYLYSHLVVSEDVSKAKNIESYIYFCSLRINIGNVSSEVLRFHLDHNCKEGTLPRPLNYWLNKFISSSKIDWDQDYHLAKIAEEFLDLGNDTRSLLLLKSTNPRRWKMKEIKASLEWQKITNKFLRSFISKCKDEDALELVRFFKHRAEPIHKIVMEMTIQDATIKDRIISEMNEYVTGLDKPNWDRITREVNNRRFYSSLILLAEVYLKMEKEKDGREVYARICNDLGSIRNTDDLQIILQKLCRSLIRFNCADFYPYITDNLFIIESIVVPYGIKGWNETLNMFKTELERIGDNESLVIVENKIALLPPIEKKETVNNTSKKKATVRKGYYLEPFDSYRMSLYNSEGDHMLETMIRLAAYNCFSNEKDERTLGELSKIFDLKKWIKLSSRLSQDK